MTGKGGGRGVKREKHVKGRGMEGKEQGGGRERGKDAGGMGRSECWEGLKEGERSGNMEVEECTEKWNGAREKARAWLAGEMSREERMAYGRWLDGDEEGRQVLRDEARTWRKVKWAWAWERLDEVGAGERVMKRVHARWRRMWWTRGVAAAVVLLAMGVGTWWWTGGEKVGVDAGQQMVIVSMEGENVPVLRLADGREVALYAGDTAVERLTAMVGARLLTSKGLVYGEEGENASRLANEEWGKERGEGAGEEGERMDGGNELQWQELRVPQGCEFNVTLADGSRVCLNAGSVLRFPAAFTGNERRVCLEGEGYFEVMKDTTAAFRVACDDFVVTALGTSFAVCCYEDDVYGLTTLAEGRVEVVSGVEKRVLEPGEQAVVAEEGIEVKEVNVLPYVSWMGDRLYFFDEQLGNILKRVSRWYGVQVKYADEQLKEWHFTGNVPKYEEIGKVFEILKLTTNLDFTLLEDGSVIVSER